MENEKKNNFKIVLLVEDDEPIIRALENRFAEENLTLIVSHDGADGLKKANEERPDLILLDIIMPKMDGITMLKKLRETDWGKKIPVIVLTNLSSPIEEQAAKELDVTDYLIKTDWKLEDLIEKIKKTLAL